LCSLAHGKVLTQFISPEDVAAIARGESPHSLTAAELAIIELARKVAKDATAVTNGDVDHLRYHGLHDAEIFDIVAIAAARSFWTKIIDSLGSDADEPSRAIDKEFRSAMTVGRPLNFVEPERLPQA
jgi:hypothetical protein